MARGLIIPVARGIDDAATKQNIAIQWDIEAERGCQCSKFDARERGREKLVGAESGHGPQRQDAMRVHTKDIGLVGGERRKMVEFEIKAAYQKIPTPPRSRMRGATTILFGQVTEGDHIKEEQ